MHLLFCKNTNLPSITYFPLFFKNRVGASLNYILPVK